MEWYNYVLAVLFAVMIFVHVVGMKKNADDFNSAGVLRNIFFAVVFLYGFSNNVF